MPRLTDVEYICDLCKEPFEPAENGPEIVLGRLSVWRPSDDPREAVRSRCGGLERNLAGAREPRSARELGRSAVSARSPPLLPGSSNGHSPPASDSTNYPAHHPRFPLPASALTYDLALHPACAERLTRLEGLSLNQWHQLGIPPK